MMIIQIAPAIKRLTLTRVGCWNNLILDFDNSLNIITGKGGCGKSTILRSILQAVHPLGPGQGCLTPTVPFSKGLIGIHFYAKSLFVDIQPLSGITEKPAVTESCGQFVLEQLRFHVHGAAQGMAVLIEDEVSFSLDDTLYPQAVELLNNATSQIICIIGHRFSLRDFPNARAYCCYMDDKDITHIELIR
jgi:energy-coupling factor transporter ATP-binding protein EcfA2